MIIRILCVMLVMLLAACDSQDADWEEARQYDTVSAYEDFVEQYPDSANADRARSRIETLRAEQAWTEAQERDTVEAYRDFLEAHPDAQGADEARNSLETLEREAVWQDLAESDNIDTLRAFADEHDGSPEAESASARASELEERAEAERLEQEREREREREREQELEREAQRQAEQGTHRVQLAVVRGEDRASSGIEHLQQRLGEVLGDIDLEAQQTNGLYRLVTQSMSREQAGDLCRSLQERGQDCLVRQR